MIGRREMRFMILRVRWWFWGRFDVGNWMLWGTGASVMGKPMVRLEMEMDPRISGIGNACKL